VGKPRPKFRRIVVVLLAVIGISGLSALGTWQLERRVWKLALIERVDQRVHAAPVAPPAPADWPEVTAADDEYLRVGVSGRFRNDQEILVRAATELGSGYWVMTPFHTDRGFTILVNRGFVPPDRLHPADRAEGQIDGETEVTGLLRMTEPKGGFLRKNHPDQDLWYSRDVAAIAAAHKLTDVAPYFIDADAITSEWPRGGLTVVAFPNNHLVYAITWFAMALLLAVGVIAAWRSEQKRPR